jgi:hypothetical protein
VRLVCCVPYAMSSFKNAMLSAVAGGIADNQYDPAAAPRPRRTSMGGASAAPAAATVARSSGGSAAAATPSKAAARSVLHSSWLGRGLYSSTPELNFINLSCACHLNCPIHPTHPAKVAQVEPKSGRVM